MPKKIQHKGNLAKKVSSLTGELADLLSFASAHRTTLFVAAGLSVLATAATLAQPLVVGRVIEAVQEGHSLLIPAGMLSVLFVVGAILSGLTRYLLGKAGEGVVLSLRNSLVGRLLRMPVEDHEKLRPGDLISRVSTDTTLLRTALVSSLTNAVSGFLMILGATALMAYVDFILLAVALTCVAGATGAVVAVTGRIRSASEEAQRSVGSLSATLGRCLGAIRTVKLSRAESSFFRRQRIVRGGVGDDGVDPLTGRAGAQGRYDLRQHLHQRRGHLPRPGAAGKVSGDILRGLRALKCYRSNFGRLDHRQPRLAVGLLREPARPSFGL